VGLAHPAKFVRRYRVRSKGGWGRPAPIAGSKEMK
jgi:hypothetical protein